MAYDMKMEKKEYKNGDAGCVKEFKEERVEMLKVGGDKYSHNNAKELKMRADKLAKVVDKGEKY